MDVKRPRWRRFVNRRNREENDRLMRIAVSDNKLPGKKGRLGRRGDGISISDMVTVRKLVKLGKEDRREGIVAATCAYTRAIDRSSRAGYPTILVLTSLANTHAHQSGRRLPHVPIRTPEW